MTEAELRAAMEAAAARDDFEEAGRLRDRISLLRGGAEAAAGIDVAGLERQQAGRMGLGSSRQSVTPPEGWVPPTKPDLMTKVRRRTSKRSPS